MKKAILFIAIFSTVSLYAAEPVSDDIHTIALFKNGSGYFMSSVDVSQGAEGFEIAPEVAPTNGTLWVSWPEGVKVDSIVASEKEFEKPIDAVTVTELLKANVGSTVKFKVGEDIVTGTLVSFDEKDVTPGPRPYMPGGKSVIPEINASVISVETDSGLFVVDAHRVENVSFLKDKIERETTLREKRVVLEGRFSDKASDAKIDISYIGKGITWVPSYVIDITNKDKAVFSAKALIINEAADLKDVKILLITGYPQIEFADIYSPMSMKNSLAQFLGSLEGSGPSPRYGITTQNVMAKGARFDMEMAAPVNYGQGVEGKQIEDMFFYPLENVSLEKEQTGYYPLFSEQVDYEHIYKWDIGDNIDKYYRYNRDEQSQEQVVWHCLKLKNDTGRPWTTAPIQTVKENLILGQSTLDFTIAGDEATVKITQAGAVKADQVEYVSDRVPNSATFFGTTYDQVTIEGSLFVTNAQKEAVNIEISKMITGKIMNTDPEAKIEKTATNVGQVNETQMLKWNVNVEPSQELELKYKYRAYLRR
jgi:hypothetical protein